MMANRNSPFSFGAALLPGRLYLTPASLLVLTLSLFSCQSTPEAVRPNLIVIFCDDLGYGDLGSFGHPTIRTPHLDRMAREGQKWTDFYSAASVCTPSRAALLTGRLPVRNGMMSPKHRVLFPDSASGIPEEEVTLAEALRDAGYATACVGKWHLGHLPQYLPTNNGFDSYFGIPYSNDMDQTRKESTRDLVKEARIEYWNVPLLRDREVVERPADQRTITKRYSEEAVRFIRENRERPFFLYLAHSLPHVPLFASEDFLGTSKRGLYGDVVEEIDHGVGRIMKALTDLGIAEHSLVVFTSDNGPWLPYREHGGSAGLLREGKGSTWEGGMREPTIFWWPGRLDSGVVMEIGSTLDLFSTFCKIAGAQVPADRIMDSVDLTSVLFGSGRESAQEHVLLSRVEALRRSAGRIQGSLHHQAGLHRTERNRDAPRPAAAVPPGLGPRGAVRRGPPVSGRDSRHQGSWWPAIRSEMVPGEDRLAQRSPDARR